MARLQNLLNDPATTLATLDGFDVSDWNAKALMQGRVDLLQAALDAGRRDVLYIHGLHPSLMELAALADTEDQAIAAVQFLLRHGHHPDDAHHKKGRVTYPWEHAAFNNYPRVVQLLFDRGSEAKRCPRRRRRVQSPMQHAVEQGWPAMVAVLASRDIR